MRTEAMIDAINSALRKESVCSECAFDCKDGKFCMLIAIGARLRELTKNVAKAQRLMREAVDDLKDADMLECSHCRHYNSTDDITDCHALDCDEADYDFMICRHEECKCKKCIDGSEWQWRGFYPEEGEDK